MTLLWLYLAGVAATFSVCVWSQHFDNGDVPTWAIAGMSALWPLLWLVFIAYWASPRVRGWMR